MAKKFKIATLNTEIDKLKSSSKISFTNIEGNESKFIEISNLLTAFNVISQKDIKASKNSVKFKGQKKVGGEAILDLAKYSLDVLGIESIELTDEHYKTSGSLDGLVYLPLIETFGKFYKVRQALRLPNGAVVERGVASALLKDAKGIFQRYADDLIPSIVEEETKEVEAISVSQQRRGFNEKPKAGDIVKIRTYKDLIAEYGEKTFDHEDQTLSLALAATRTYGLQFFKGVSYLEDKEAVITKINSTTGVAQLEVNLDGNKVSDISEFKDEAGETINLNASIRFHETHLVKI